MNRNLAARLALFMAGILGLCLILAFQEGL